MNSDTHVWSWGLSSDPVSVFGPYASRGRGDSGIAVHSAGSGGIGQQRLSAPVAIEEIQRR